jgi:hypothetical protein
MRLWIVSGLALLVGAASAEAADHLQFWNLTANTINELYMAPAGTTNWGPNQCLNDVEDKTVEADEKLSLSGVDAGRYDVKLTDVTGRSCLVKNVTVRATGKYAFSIAEKDLTDCKK